MNYFMEELGNENSGYILFPNSPMSYPNTSDLYTIFRLSNMIESEIWLYVKSIM
jgi:hypothetical protein